MIRKILGEETVLSILTNDPSNMPKDEKINVILDPLLLPVYLKTHRKLDGIKSIKNLNLIRFFIDCDAVVVRGGDAFSSVYGSLSLLSRVLESYPSVMLQKRVAFLGHTFEPLIAEGPIGSFALRLLKKELDLASFVTVREEQSRIRLKKLGIDDQKIFVAPDVAFLLEHSKREVAENILHKIVNRDSSSVIGVTNSYSLYNLFTKSGVKDEYSSFVAKILDRLVTNFDVKIVLLPHSFIPGKDDRRINWEIYERSTQKAFIYPLPGVFSPELAKALIGCFDMVVSFGRLHPIIHSVSQGVPCMGLDYSCRMEGFFNSLDLNGYSIRLTELDFTKFMDTFDRIWSKRDAVSIDLQEKMQLVEARSVTALDLFRTFLCSGN